MNSMFMAPQDLKGVLESEQRGVFAEVSSAVKSHMNFDAVV